MVSNVTTESYTLDLFTLGVENIKKERRTKPFTHQVRFHGPQGEIVRVKAHIDDGAMKEVMSTETFRKVKHRLGVIRPTSQLLRLANGAVVKSEARWEGEIEVNGIKAQVTFEVFDSGGKWDFLFGKTLLETFKAVHNYETEEITLNGTNGTTTIRNQSLMVSVPKIQLIHLTTEEEPQNGDNQHVLEVNTRNSQEDSSLFTHMTNPHKPERIEEILHLVNIGENLSAEE